MKKANSNTYENWAVSGIGGNSVTFADKDFVTESWGFMIQTVAGGDIAGVCAENAVMASDNQTVAKATVNYEKQKESTTYEVEGSGQTILFDADIVTSNTIDMDVNGVAMTQVTYATSSTATIAAVAAQLVTDFPALFASTTAGSGARTVVIDPIEGNDSIVITNIVVAAWASQAGSTYADAAIAQADEGKYYDVTSVGHKVRISSAHASSGQLKLEKYVSTTKSHYRVANT